MKIIADTHTHTVASGHAYSTITENARAARERGLRFLCMTDHAPKLLGAPTEVFFGAMMNILPPEIEGVHILRGVEVNILDREGNLDLKPRILAGLEWVIASMHNIVYEPEDVAALRGSLGAQKPFEILPAVWLSSVFSVAVGLLAAVLLEDRT